MSSKNFQNEKFSNNINLLRKRFGLSVENLAIKVGCSVPQIYQLEKASRRLSHEWMIKIAKAFNCKPEDLIAQDLQLQALQISVKCKQDNTQPIIVEQNITKTQINTNDYNQIKMIIENTGCNEQKFIIFTMNKIIHNLSALLSNGRHGLEPVPVVGNDMSPTLKDGAIAIVNTNDFRIAINIKKIMVFEVRYDSQVEYIFRYVQRDADGRITLSSEKEDRNESMSDVAFKQKFPKPIGIVEYSMDRVTC